MLVIEADFSKRECIDVDSYSLCNAVALQSDSTLFKLIRVTTFSSVCG